VSSNAIVPTNAAEFGALMAGGGIGFEDTFIKPTFIELGQRTSMKHKDAQPGKLFDVLTGENKDSIQVVPLALRRGRVLFPEGGDLGAQPICRSADGIVPSPFAQYPQNRTCKECPKASWDDYDRKTGKGKPACKESWQLLVVMRDTGLPRKLKVTGMSIAPMKQLMEHLKQNAVESKMKGEGNRNIFDYTFTVGTQFVESKQGNYYTLKFSEVKRIVNVGEFGPLFVQYVQSQKAQQAETEDAQSAVEEAVEAEVQV
jgi:hypothetical protein